VLTLVINAGADQNPDPSARPAPVAVDLYQLAATGNFERADVFALVEREKQTLGEEGLTSEELLLAPGEKRTITRELKKGTQFVGTAVLFRDIDRATWKQVAPVAAAGLSGLTLTISGTTSRLASG
jgi:type VI secretion system protein VasD